MAGGSLAGKRAIVTGGSRGIGGAIALAFAREGAELAICHWQDEANAKTAEAAIAGLGRKVFVAPCDVASPAACKAFAAAAERAIGPIDILVNNAGINVNQAFAEISEADYDRMMDVHMKGAFFMTQAVYPGMVARRAGRIINLTSQLVFKGALNLTHYTAAKGAILGFTRALAGEAAPHGVLVNAIAPGPVDTALLKNLTEEWRAAKRRELPIGRFALPEEIAPTALLLAGPGGTYYVGATLSPNGGDVYA